MAPNTGAHPAGSGIQQRMSDLLHLAHAAARLVQRAPGLWERLAIHPHQA
jgi:hypothetical protein